MMIFITQRLIIRKAVSCDEDIDFFYRIWTNPEVVKFVGFPKGLRITKDEIAEGINRQDDTEYNKKLIVELKSDKVAIGECKLGLPDGEGISETDVKLLPEYWGKGYGTEIKRGLVDYLFENTDCISVKASPNKDNIASQKMQEAVGGIRTGEGVFEFLSEMKGYTCDVPYYEYRVYRKDWKKK